MEKLIRKIDSHRRQLDDLILAFAKERNARQHEWQKKIPDRIERSMELLQEAKNKLFMAQVALG